MKKLKSLLAIIQLNDWLILFVLIPLIGWSYHQHQAMQKCFENIQSASYEVVISGDRLNNLAHAEDKVILALYPHLYQNEQAVERVPPSARVRKYLGIEFYQRQTAAYENYSHAQANLNKFLTEAKDRFSGTALLVDDYNQLTITHLRDPLIPTAQYQQQIAHITTAIKPQINYFSFAENRLYWKIIKLFTLFLMSYGSFRLLKFIYKQNGKKTISSFNSELIKPDNTV